MSLKRSKLVTARIQVLKPEMHVLSRNGMKRVFEYSLSTWTSTPL